MNAQRRFGLSLSWPRLAVVFLLVVLILVVGSHCPESWQGDRRIAFWVGVGVASIVALVSLLTHYGHPVTSGLASWLWDWSADPSTTLAAGCTTPIDYQRKFGRDTVGVREYEGLLVSVIGVHTGAEDVPGRHRHRTSGPSASALLVRPLANALRQFDIQLDCIDIVSVKRPRPSAGQLADDIRADEWMPASAQPDPYARRTWVVLRLNPQNNIAAVAARDSLASTLVAATERLAQELDGQGISGRPLTADELVEVDRAVLADLEPTWSRPGWHRLKHFGGYATSFWLTPTHITTDTLSDLWLPETEATVVTVRLTSDRGRPQVAAWVRYHSARRLPGGVPPALNRLTGRQLAAVRASLPAPTARPLMVVPGRPLLDDDRLLLDLGQAQAGTEPAPAR